MNENNSGVNTIILVIILVVIVAGGVWYLKGAGSEQEGGATIDVTIPSGDGGSSETSQ